MGIKSRFADIDLLLCAGDLPLDYLDFIISSLNKPLIFVFGNHHTNELKYYKKAITMPMFRESQEEKEYQGCGAIYGGTRIISEVGLIIAGLGGSMRYNDGNNQFTEFEMYIEIFKLIPRLLWNRIRHKRYLDILLTHAPPRGIHDKNDKCHMGFKAFLWFIKHFKPKFHVHGHTHLYDLNDIRCTKWENTMVINAYSHYVIETGE